MPTINRAQVIAFLSELSPPELRALILDLEDRWGIERPFRGEPSFVTMGAPWTPWTVDDEVWTLVLVDPGPKPVLVMKAIRERINIGLQEVKALVDRAPAALLDMPSRSDAEQLLAAVTEVGARGEVRVR